jgi:hypothetical protein
MSVLAPKFISHHTNCRNNTYKRKYFLIVLQILLYILQIRVTEIAGHKCNINKQFEAQLKTRYPHIQGVPGGMCQTSGGCSLCYSIPI